MFHRSILATFAESGSVIKVTRCDRLKGKDTMIYDSKDVSRYKWETSLSYPYMKLHKHAQDW